MSESADGAKDGGPDGGMSAVEKAIILVSVAFTVSLFAFAAVQMVSTHSATAPTVDVVNRQTMENGDVVFVVKFANDQDAGIESATVEANCTSPPTTLEFTNVPSDGTRYGRIVCPPGTEDPGVSVAAWKE
ncbi:hypothetical protein [Halopelagius longus]|uniref:Archaeal Type IV pilin N-terminal domain-containing protein n=1 Tax=Halopelagius longus TaxID=1236180 RepID=A0A1H1GLK3_9EURY|nr:hypothetical protein [Halopelagius longus]RDI69668.1 hypothetical protein DWB78_18020 [Halopelagius longus]SDR14065.1 hypothetical protein SAMN05216278_3752 [Halopelagius longus]